MAFLRDHQDTLEVDLLGMGIDLPRDLGTDRLTWRRLGLLVEHLPATSATARAVNPDAEWTLAEHLLAAVLDALNGANWQRGGGKGSYPHPVPRPSDRFRVGRLHVAGLAERLIEQRERTARREVS